AKNVQSLQTGDCLPMQSLRWSRPIGHDHYRNVRQSDPQIQHSQLDNWAADLRHRLPTAERFSATGVTEISPRSRWSLRLDAGGLDHLAPFLGFLGAELAKIGGRARKHCIADIGKPRLDLGVVEARVNFAVQLINDFGGSVSRCTHSKEATGFEAGHKLAHGGDLGQHFPSASY